MFSEYEKGRTPNPDILCNREIKFDSFAEEAKKLGGDFVATGHYCRKESICVNNVLIYRLMTGKDVNKDQSYFLCQLSQEQLAYARSPPFGQHRDGDDPRRSWPGEMDRAITYNLSIVRGHQGQESLLSYHRLE
jgi:tRNA U34 2-thiouridine synthase MnmA/TrmU